MRTLHFEIGRPVNRSLQVYKNIFSFRPRVLRSNAGHPRITCCKYEYVVSYTCFSILNVTDS